jgi:transposase
VGSTDMRKSINGLSVLVEQSMELNPYAWDLLFFCDRRRNMIKNFGIAGSSVCNHAGGRIQPG